MNIFILDHDVKKSAEALCDKHVVKMVLETAQLLCSQFDPGTAPYKRTHYNHPCSKWCRENTANYAYLIEYGLHLLDEYSFRYNKTHKCEQIIHWCKQNAHLLNLPYSKSITPFAQAMPDRYKHKDAVVAYRTYYLHEKAKLAKWSKARTPPDWWPWHLLASIIAKLWN